MQTILNSDTIQIFNDWGQSAILEEVEAYYDPDTARMEESVVSSSIIVLAGAVQTEQAEQTVAITHSAKNLFIVQEVDFPLHVNLVTARVVYKDQAFKVEAISQSHIPATVVLECVCYSDT